MADKRVLISYLLVLLVTKVVLYNGNEYNILNENNYI